MNGYLFIIEGPDGVGKTTMSQKIVTRWQAEGIPSLYYSFPGREEGTVGHLVYRLHHQDTELGVKELNPVSLQIMHIAAHIDAIDRVIRPALEQGKRVVLDRYWWSTWVYGMESGITPQTLDAMIAVERAHWGSILPSVAFLVTRKEPLRVETSAERWSRLTHLYDSLASREKAIYSVIQIPNEQEIEPLVTALQQNIERVIEASEQSQ